MLTLQQESYTAEENGTGLVEVCVQFIGIVESNATLGVVLATEDGSAVSGGQGIPLPSPWG